MTAGLTASESNIAVKPAAASSLKVTGFPTSDTAGTAGDVVLTAYDAYGNVATGYSGTVSLTSSDPHAVLPPSVTFAGTTGTYAFAMTLDTAGSQSITATDTAAPTITATEAGIMVQAAAAKTLTIAGFPTSDTAGAAGDVVVTAYDAYGNRATGYAGTISLASSDSHAILAPSRYTFVAADEGEHTFFVTLETAGTQTITATDTVTASLTATESNIAVKPGAAAILKVTGFPKSDTAGAAGNVVVTAYDAYGNVATGYTGTISFSSSDPRAVLPSGFSLSAVDLGTHAFSVTLETVGAQSITATDMANATISGTESDILVRATPQVTWSSPASIVYGTPLGAAQLDAVANVPGTFSYTPAAGTILDAGGGHTLSVEFTPQDVTDYTTAATTTTIGTTKATPSLEVTSSAGSAVYGQPVSFVATVSAVAGTPAGTVTFSDGATPLATVPLDGSATATFTSTALSVGSHSITATYSGDADFLGVQSAPYSETVAQAGTEVVVVENSVFQKKRLISVGLTVQVDPLSPGGGVPTGDVTFELVTKTKKHATVKTLARTALAGGRAMSTLVAKQVLQKAITIVYNGDANDEPSTLTTGKLG